MAGRNATERLSADSVGIARAVDLLTAGELVAFPTETVYGLGADARNPNAVAKIYAAKARPSRHPLIVHLAQRDAVKDWAELNATGTKLAGLWPGPLTLVLPRTDRVAPNVTGGRSTVGVRVPDHPVAHAFLAAFDSGVAAPSANRFGGVSPTTADHVLSDLNGKIAAVIDGGPCLVGVESTIVEVVGPQAEVLRPGGVSVDQLVQQGVAVTNSVGGPSRAPGMLASHYAPSARCVLATRDGLNAVLVAVDSSAAVIAPFKVDHPLVWQLPSDTAGYAHQLYATLRQADAHPSRPKVIVIVPPDDGALLPAIVDRLAKAAAAS